MKGRLEGGHGLLEPLPLTVGEEHRQCLDWFRFTSDERGEYVLQCDVEGAWANLYSFTLEPWLPVDYQFANYYHSHAPESPFVQRRICTMPTLEGRMILTDRSLKFRSGQRTSELHVESEETCRQLLQEHFGLTINDHLRFLV